MTDRDFLRADLWEQWGTLVSPQGQGLPQPPIQKPPPPGAATFELLAPERLALGQMPVCEALAKRRSRRRYSGAAIDQETLSYLLWATQGVRAADAKGQWLSRTVPSAGSRHPFETYLLLHHVTGLATGLYRYLSVGHRLCLLAEGQDWVEHLYQACYQQYVRESAVVFVWSALPARTEWRYAALSPKLIALDAGHVCQNLYLACESVGLGTCAIGAYNQRAMDAALGLDGHDEFAIYAATVGVLKA